MNPELTRISTAFVAAMLLYLTTGLFLHFAYIRFFWLIAALAAAAARIGQQELAGSTSQAVVVRSSATDKGPARRPGWSLPRTSSQTCIVMHMFV